MKSKAGSAMVMFGIVLAGIWILSRMPFETKIDQTVSAGRYWEGVMVEETKVSFNGSRSNYLFSGEQYYDGRVVLEHDERTGREGMKANIGWNEGWERQRILYYQNATFPVMEIDHDILIDREMKAFAIGFRDGTVIATSKDLYQKYKDKTNPGN